MASVTVEEVDRGKGLERFAELPHALHGSDTRFAPLIMSWERYRVSRWRNPYVREASIALFLARRGGRPVGRIAAHVPAVAAAAEGPADGLGRFGFWSCVDDPRVAEALVGVAGEWLAGQGCTALTGPWSFGPDDEPGLLAGGHAVPGTTGRPWRPPSEADRLVEALGTPAVSVEERTWRLPTTEVDSPLPPGGPVPGQAGRHVDPRLVLEGIAAVPDVSDALRAGGIRSGLRVARQARDQGWTGCTVVRCSGDPAVAVPALLGAAGRAGYRWAIVPWSPDPGAEPETIHHRLQLDL